MSLNNTEEHFDVLVRHRGDSSFWKREMFRIKEIGQGKAREQSTRMYVLLLGNG
jgi:hypothetical protein